MQNKGYIFTAVRLGKDHKKKAKKIGKGNQSLGMRTAIEAYKLEVKSIDVPEKVAFNKA